MVFRKDRTGIEDTVGQFSGLGSRAGSELMSIAAPLILAVFKQRIRDEGLTVSSFTLFLAAEAAKIEELDAASLSKLVIGDFIPATGSIYPKKPKSTVVPRGLILPVGVVALALVARPVSGGSNRGLTLNLSSNAKGRSAFWHVERIHPSQTS